MVPFPSSVSTLLFVAFALAPSTAAAGGGPGQIPIDVGSQSSSGDADNQYSSHAPLLPPNLEFAEALRPILHRMWRYSPTFRRQCARLAEAQDLTVVIFAGQLPDHWKDRARALTRISGRSGGRLRADVLLGLVDLELHIAHELEHIIERIDGVHVELMSALAIEGVDRHGSAFETARAKATGRAVAREVVAAQLFARRQF
jgi:hypothetical protein